MNRFWSKVNTGDPEQCWEWEAGKLPKGYGSFRVNNPRRKVLAHRVAWELSNGPIPDGLNVCHRCDNPPCCNPAHLFLGTDKENHDDKVAKGRQVCGERTPGSKLKASQVDEIRALHSSGNASQVELVRRFGVSAAQVCRIVNGTRWRVSL